MTSINQLLSSSGLRQTKARKIVLGLLQEVEYPLSHQELSAHPRTAALDRVTLYRTLVTLQQAGLLHRVQGTDGVWRFGDNRHHPGSCAGDHIHFLCLECHRMICLPEQQLPWIEAPPGATVSGKQLVVYGTCADCEGPRRG